MKHTIPADAMNSWVRFCVDEFVRDDRHKDILLRKWFDGDTIEQLAEDFGLSETSIKTILYDEGDEILLKALDLTERYKHQKPSGY